MEVSRSFFIFLILFQIDVFPSAEKNTENVEFFLDAGKSQLPRCEYSGPPLNLTKLCSYRGSSHLELIFLWRAGHGCFQYTQPALLRPTDRETQVSECYTPLGNASCMILPKNAGGIGCFPFADHIPEVLQELSRVFISEEAVKRWSRCVDAAKKCCDRLEQNVPPPDGCPGVWDGWDCWDPALAGEQPQRACPEFAYSNSGPTCQHFSSKTCFPNSTWHPTTDYSTCSARSRLTARVHVHAACLIVSLVLGVPAVLVMTCARALRGTALHRNVLAAILARNLLTLITKTVVVMNELSTTSGATIMSNNGAPCRILSTLERLAASSAFTAMLMDGVFLHRRITAPFKSEYNVKKAYALAIGTTVLPIVIWCSLMASLNDDNCWLVYRVSGIQWTLDGPRLLMLLINLVLLLNILRILFTQMRREDSSNHSSNMSTIKAALFLMPLFGVQFLLTAFRPNTTSCAWEQAYYYFTYVMDGMQAILVAILYCYCNKDVCAMMKATYRKTENLITVRFHRHRRPPSISKRNTLSTVIDEQDNPKNDKKISKDKSLIDNKISSDHGFKNILEAKQSIASCSKETNLDDQNDEDVFSENNFDSFNAEDDGFVSIGFEFDSEDAVNPNNQHSSPRTNILRQRFFSDPDAFKIHHSYGNLVHSRSLADHFKVSNEAFDKFTKRNNDNDLELFSETSSVFSDEQNNDEEYTKRPTIELVCNEGETIARNKNLDSKYVYFVDENENNLASEADSDDNLLNPKNDAKKDGHEKNSPKAADEFGVENDALKKDDEPSTSKTYKKESSVIIDPKKLCPNRADSDRIIFV